MSECNISQHSEDAFDETAVVEIKGDQAANDSAAGRLNLSSIDMWALGVCIAVSGTYYAWNVGYEAGFGSYVVARFLVSTAYVSLILSISELSSGLPFAGGAYGIARVTLGPFAGYMVACYESMETVVACSALIYSFAKAVVMVSDIDITWEPWIWALFYAVYIALHSWGGRLFWNSVMALAVGNIILIIIYLLGSARYANLAENAAWPGDTSNNAAWFRGGLFVFVRFVPSCCNGFTCIECVNLACKDVQNPKRDIPRGFVASVLTQAVCCLSVVFITASVAPGIVAASTASAPLTNGYMKIFDCSLKQATVLSLPGLCAAAFGRMFSYGRQISAMGRSGMINPFFGQELQSRHTPFYGLVLGGVVGYGLCLISYFEPSVQLVQMTQMALLGAFTSYFAQLCSFIMFQGTFSIIKREFISPLGIPGAVYSMFWFIIAFMSIAFFQDNHFAITGYAVFTGCALLYYYSVVQYRQYFSDEEKTILFRAHLVKNNTNKAAKLRKGKYAPSSMSTGHGAHAGSLNANNNNSNGSNSSISWSSTAARAAGSPRRSQAGTPKRATSGNFHKVGSLNSLSEAGGVDVSRSPLPSAPPSARVEDETRSFCDSSVGPELPLTACAGGAGTVTSTGIAMSQLEGKTPLSHTAPQTSSPPQRVSRTYSLLSGLTALYAADEAQVLPLKTGDKFSIEDLEAHTFRGSARIKPTSQRIHSAQSDKNRSQNMCRDTNTEETLAGTTTTTTSATTSCAITPTTSNEEHLTP